MVSLRASGVALGDGLSGLANDGIFNSRDLVGFCMEPSLVELDGPHGVLVLWEACYR